jgi:phage terminase large subunit-like protein
LDWEDRIRSGRTLIPDLPLDQERGGRAVSVFNRLRIANVTGQPTFETAAGDWQRDIIRAVHGSMQGVDGTLERLIREIFVLIPKKQSKTTGAAGWTMTEFLLNERPQAEFLLVASTQAIASIAFRQLSGMVKADEYLGGLPGQKGRMRVQDNIKRITDTQTDATLQVRSFDADVLTGVIPTWCLLDELHLMSNDPRAADIIGQIRGGMISQAEAALFFITTQSFKPPAGVFLDELNKARNIRDGIDRDTRMMPVLYEFPDDIARAKTERGKERWRDSKIWHWVTPNAGKSITIPRLEEEYQVAVKTGEEEVRRWASQHLNIQIGLSLRNDRWPGADFWENAGTEPTLTVEELVRRCDYIAGGIDGGGLDDLLGGALVGRETDTGLWLAICRAWAHEGMLDRRKSEAATIRDFAAAGDLTIVKDITDAYSDLAAWFAIPAKGQRLGQVGIDPLGLGLILEALEAAEISNDFFDGEKQTDRMIGIPQGYRLQMPIKTSEVKLSNGTLLHTGSPLMAWAVGNARQVQAGNAILITKQASGTAKIDPLMALFDAIAILATNPKPMRSGYEDHPVRFLDTF